MSHERRTESLSQSVALVTGAGRGLGRATGLRLSQDGAAVAIHYRQSAEGAESLATQIRAENRPVTVVNGDIRDPAQVTSMVAQIERELGAISILVNNAVAFYPGELAGLNEAEMEEMWRTNVQAPIHIIQAVAEGMKKRRFGRIINIASVAAFGTAVQGPTFYSATKSALIALTRRFAMDLGPYGITVNAVAPGFVPTDGSLGGRTGDEAKARIEMFASRAMVGRVGTPEDIANAVAFLASSETSFITAQVLTVDGGRMDYISHP